MKYLVSAWYTYLRSSPGCFLKISVVIPVPLDVLCNTSSAVYIHNYQHLRNTGTKAFSGFLLINKTDEKNDSELPVLVMVSDELSQHERSHVFKQYCSL